jgi:hypothetical protein
LARELLRERGAAPAHWQPAAPAASNTSARVYGEIFTHTIIATGKE